MNFLFHAHSGLRYIVLLVGLVAIAVLAIGLIRKKPIGAERGLTAAFVGVLDLQVLLGKKATDPNRATLLRLWGVVVPFILIVLGILAIGRSVF